MAYVFFGKHVSENKEPATKHERHDCHAHCGPHESPSVMTMPLVILAFFAIFLGFINTPAWPWFHGYLAGHAPDFDLAKLGDEAVLMCISAVIVLTALSLGWVVYGKIAQTAARETDPIERAQPFLWRVLSNKFYIDELYEVTIIRLNALFAIFSDWLDRAVWGGAVKAVSCVAIGFSWLSRKIDEDLVNGGFDHGCNGLRDSAQGLSRGQNGQTQRYFKILGFAFAALILVLIWRAK
jgi:NADH-quinone oxidoreductase subunit L